MRKFIFKSSTHYYGSEQDDPAFFTEGMRRPASAALGPRARHRGGRAGGERVRRAEPRRHGDRAALRERARARRGYRVHAHVPPARWCRWCSASTLGSSSCTRTTSCTPSSTPPSTSRPASTTWPPTACWRCPRSSACSASGRCRSCRPGARAWSRARCAGSGFRIPDEVVNQLRFGRGVDNRLLKATGFRYGYTTRETVLKLGEHLRLAPVMQGRRADLHVRARGRGVPALEPLRAA